MPNAQNILRPALIIGAGRTASSYMLDRLEFGQGTFAQLIENTIYRDMLDVLTKAWWSKFWRFVGDEQECRKRILDSIRAVHTTAFPDDKPNWVMKMIWSDHDPDFVDELFPEARFIHLTRHPCTNIASMMEFLNHDEKEAEEAYVKSNQNALAFRRFGDRYLHIRQEDLIQSRKETWDQICDFLGVERRPAEKWERELNASPSTKGKVDAQRQKSRIEWNDLTPAIREMAETLGYQA